MKKFLPLLLLVIAFGCKKDSLKSLKSQLPGTWELRNIQGGFYGPSGPPDVTPGNGNRWTFSGSEYQLYSRGRLIKSGTYTLIKKDTYGGAYPATALVLDANAYETARISIGKGTLTMYAGNIAADGSIEEYVRQ